jgi:adenylate cyclase
MLNKIYLLLSFIVISYPGFSQVDNNNSLDSLLNKLKNEKPGLRKADILNQLATKILETGVRNREDSVLLFTDQAIELSRKQAYPEGLAHALYNLGRYHISSTKRYAEATPSLLESLSIFEALNDSAGISKCFLQLGLISYVLQYYEDGIKNLKNSLQYYPNATSNYLLAISYSELDSISDAKKYFSLAMQDFEKQHSFRRLNDCYMFIGKLFTKTGETDSAFYYLNKAIFNMYSSKDPLADSSSLTRPYAFISDVYLKVNDVNKAIYYAETSFNIDEKHVDEIAFLAATNTLSKAYAIKGDYKKAFLYLDLYNKTNDAYLKGSTKQKVADMQSMFDFKKRINEQKFRQQKDMEIAEQQIQKEIILRNSFLVGSGLLFLLLLLLYNRYTIKQNANKALEGKNKIISEEKERSENLLLNILPVEVAEELKTKGSAEAKQFPDVTVMFTDFKDFSQIAEFLSPSELVHEIDLCYKAFDNIINKHNIEKIKTIGDSYMCAGGLPIANKTNAIDVVNAACEIQQFMLEHLNQRKRANKQIFEMRIGVHTGPVVAGIVGVRKFAYDIWGDTVNIASRMESSGEVGKVNVSGSTYEIIKDYYACTYRGKIFAKNKGEIDMYFVEHPL